MIAQDRSLDTPEQPSTGGDSQVHSHQSGELAGPEDVPATASGPSLGSGQASEPYLHGTVTVLFTDVVRSTELHESRGDNAARRILRTQAELIRAQLIAHGGREVKGLGDGVMAAFASARSAVESAAGIQRALAEHNRTRPEEHVEVRIGINSGDASEEHGDLFGAAVNAAARVAAKAKGGEILVSSVVRELAGQVPDLSFVDRGRFRLKGFEGRRQLFEVAWQRPSDSITPTVVERTAFVGRDAERDEIRRHLAAAAEGHGAVAVVEGEGGIGKTRLLYEIGEDAKRLGFEVFRGGAEELERDLPFGAIGAALLDAPGPETSDRRRLKRLLASGSGSSSSREAESYIGAGARYSILDLIVSYIEEAAGRRPVLLELDDIQWADSSTLAAINRLARRSGSISLAMVCACRPLPREPEVEAIIDRIRLSGGSFIALGALEDAAVEQLAASALDSRIGDRLRAQLVSAGGNPFFVTELLGALRDADAIALEKGRADVTSSLTPPTLRPTVLRRLAHLSPEALRVLRVASVLGLSFTVADLGVALDRRTAELIDALQSAVRAGILRERGERLAFRHDLVREAIYEDMPVGARAALHLETGRAFAGSGRPAQQIAAHFALGAEKGDAEAIGWLERAAAEVSSRAPAVAVDYLRRALELVFPDYPDLANLKVELARSLLWSGRLAEAEAVADELLGMRHPPSAAVTLDRLLGRVFIYRGHTVASIARVEKALAEPDIPTDLRAQLLGELALRQSGLGNFDTVETNAEEAIRLGKESGNEFAVSTAFSAIARVATQRADLARALDFGTRAVEIASGPGSEPGQLIQPRLYEGLALLEADQLDEAAATFETGRRVAHEVGTAWGLPLFHGGVALVRFHSGAWDDAIAEAETCLAMAEEEGTRLWNLYALGVLLHVALHRGQLGQANDLLVQADALTLSCGAGLPGLERIEWGRALLAESEGRIADAFDILQSTLDEAEQIDKLAPFREMGPDLSRLGREVGRQHGFAGVVDATEQMAMRAGTAGAEVAALRCSGIAAADSERLLRAAKLALQVPRPLERAAAAEDAGTMAATDGSLVETAVQLLEEAVEVYASLGAVRDMDRVEEHLRRAGVRRQATPSTTAIGWDSLNQREVGVIRAVAQGLTNRQIGELMLISPRTVETHLSHIFRKVGLSTRVQLGSEAGRRGFLEDAPSPRR